MSLKINLLAAGAVATIAGAGVLGASSVSAQTADQNTRAQELAERFDLDPSEVEAYFSEKRAERQEARSEKRAEHLQSLVDAGTITEEQRTLLEEKRAELKAEREANKEAGVELTDEEREAKKAEFEQWAEDNGINLDEVRQDRGNGHRHGRNR